MSVEIRSPGVKWRVLAAGTIAQTVSSLLVGIGAFLIPHLHSADGPYGLGLGHAGAIAAAPTVGLMLTLVAWGAVVDRLGERGVLLAGMLLGAIATGTAVLVVSVAGGALGATVPPAGIAAVLFLAGIAAASANAASGRLVVGWFPADQRGLAMGLRQMAQPLGIAAAAVIVPVTAEASGVAAVLAVAAASCLGAVAVLVRWAHDPARPRAGSSEALELRRSPYTQGSGLVRVHAAAVLLVVPQFTLWSLAMVWLISEQGFSPLAAGVFVGITQLAGAAGRVGAGVWSDRAGSRTGPMRIIAIAAVLVMLVLAVADLVGATTVALIVLVAASVITVADNGLAYTAAAEIAGPFWGGRVLGLHNTAQNALASAVPPVAGIVVELWGFPWLFAGSAAFALLAVPLVPGAITSRQ
ncbi:MFS transporter [Hoyosella sp. G463]|uniref:MFS transporter n=1 Tax=Lolliginicoccus lacisalsi TaxID=2742202 RepID=A0A927PN45_9ACTN|nr:MFS transporter [Lolliginicoccus lacisalsi]MBD8507562.1 MFS transporter [Lolliginicoccus lacisalsi]